MRGFILCRMTGQIRTTDTVSSDSKSDASKGDDNFRQTLVQDLFTAISEWGTPEGDQAVDHLKHAMEQSATDFQEVFQRILSKAGGEYTVASAGVFHDFSLPAGLRDLLDNLIKSMNQQSGEFSIGGQNGGPLDGKEAKEIEEEKTQQENIAILRDQMQSEEERQREQLEWSQSTHSAFGANLTGKQWGELSDKLKSSKELEEWLIQRLMRDGRSREEAERKAKQMQKVYDNMRKPESELSYAERQQRKAAKADPDFTQNTPALAEHLGINHIPKDISQASLAGEMTQSTAVGADVLSSDSNSRTPSKAANTQTVRAEVQTERELFASAPALGEHYQEALAATKPLDTQNIEIAKAAPQPVPQPAMSAGFDV